MRATKLFTTANRIIGNRCAQLISQVSNSYNKNETFLINRRNSHVTNSQLSHGAKLETWPVITVIILRSVFIIIVVIITSWVNSCVSQIFWKPEQVDDYSLFIRRRRGHLKIWKTFRILSECSNSRINIQSLDLYNNFNVKKTKSGKLSVFVKLSSITTVVLIINTRVFLFCIYGTDYVKMMSLKYCWVRFILIMLILHKEIVGHHSISRGSVRKRETFCGRWTFVAFFSHSPSSSFLCFRHKILINLVESLSDSRDFTCCVFSCTTFNLFIQLHDNSHGYGRISMHVYVPTGNRCDTFSSTAFWKCCDRCFHFNVFWNKNLCYWWRENTFFFIRNFWKYCASYVKLLSHNKRVIMIDY